ncbi:tripartite tricarboxylate transporter TctB family protein [Ornithinibacillus salinisoli]|uniref:Tripartite tricarboxylate transporter TctB family protein n=1 Tax=Ornithinibacillus salinisoli TaxID=1848459 RepID=A0ABW4W1S7_9BACI
MGEIVIGILLILLSAIIFFNSGDFQQLNETHLDPGSYPKLVALILALLASFLVIKKTIELMKTKASSFDVGIKEFSKELWKEHKLVILILITLGLYIMLLDVIGFIVSSIAFIIATGLIIGPRKKKNMVTISFISLVVTFGMYYFFESVLYVRFPDGIFF